MKYYFRFFLLLVVVAMAATDSSAIIIRHDRADSSYQNQARNYPQVCAIGRFGAGTLIAPEWVLTAAHVANAAGKRNPKIIFGKTEYEVAEVFIYPGWTKMQPNDIGLIRLNKPVEGIKPAEVMKFTKEKNIEIIFVGNGGTGTGLTGPTREDSLWRAATNVIDRVDDKWLFFDFDDPNDSSVETTELEGISGPGDSGGPALYKHEGILLVLGVSVFSNPGKKGRGTYGAGEGYTRVSSCIDWIKKTLRKESGSKK